MKVRNTENFIKFELNTRKIRIYAFKAFLNHFNLVIIDNLINIIKYVKKQK